MPAPNRENCKPRGGEFPACRHLECVRRFYVTREHNAVQLPRADGEEPAPAAPAMELKGARRERNAVSLPAKAMQLEYASFAPAGLWNPLARDFRSAGGAYRATVF